MRYILTTFLLAITASLVANAQQTDDEKNEVKLHAFNLIIFKTLDGLARTHPQSEFDLGLVHLGQPTERTRLAVCRISVNSPITTNSLPSPRIIGTFS